MKAFVLPLCFLAAALCGTSTVALAQQTTASSDSLVTRANIKDNTIFWRDGKLVQNKGGKLHEVQEPIVYDNGTTVLPDGRVRTKDGKTLTLKLKHAVSPQGRVVLVADDIFTYGAIVDHERQVVGDTETRIVVIDGQVSSVSNHKEKQVYSLGQEKRIQLLEQLVQLLEQRSKLLEAALSDSDRKNMEAYYNGLNKQLSAVELQLKNLPAAK
ncbi:DUF6799 domain-containing protein [Rufibacter ruber]|uniref:DUF6799 domain-containing protein n=1 Tax=Rufibacter ruber TaxID=1783499 RepID=UPI0008309DE2|nr:DUF6799 domain-containing protein [Rufibacter ruber]